MSRSDSAATRAPDASVAAGASDDRPRSGHAISATEAAMNASTTSVPLQPIVLRRAWVTPIRMN